MNLNLDISLSTVIVSCAVLVSGLLVRGASWLIVESAKTLVTKMAQTIATVEMLESKIDQILELTYDIPKIKSDLNVAHQKIRDLSNSN